MKSKILLAKLIKLKKLVCEKCYNRFLQVLRDSCTTEGKFDLKLLFELNKLTLPIQKDDEIIQFLERRIEELKRKE